ncbi:MAG: c-type cytochrome [Sphingomonadaceae bacterium]
MKRRTVLLLVAVLVPAAMVAAACAGGAAPEPTTAKPAATAALATQPPATAASVPTQPSAAQAPAASGAEQGDVAAGQAVFNQNCGGCHPGGGSGVGPALRGKNLAADTIRNKVRTGGGSMPAFPQSRISDQQLSDVIAYVQSLR